MTPEDIERRLAARRNNESVKLLATTLNAIALTIVGAAVIVPGVNHSATLIAIGPGLLLLAAFALHVGAHLLFRLLRSED